MTVAIDPLRIPLMLVPPPTLIILRYMDGMDMNVLSDMPYIKKRLVGNCSSSRSFIEAHCYHLTEVTVVTHMVNACNSMRCYNRATSNSPLAQFSNSSKDSNDSGDCDGIPVFTFWSIALFEELAWEVVQMFVSEPKLKRLLVMDLLSIYDDNVAEVVGLNWSDEFYEGEFKDLYISNLLSKETCEQCCHPLKVAHLVLQLFNRSKNRIVMFYRFI